MSCAPRPPQNAASAPPPAPGDAPVTPALDALTEGQKLLGFSTRAVYLDAGDRAVGARFVHDATGFVLDFLRIESAPQGFVWVNSLPTSDMGEPHTQEHLLLGKGDRGRRLGGVEAMALGESSAFTAQWRTAYHFHTVAGPEAFWTVFDNQLDALLHPDYSDEEIRREVAHYGTTANPDGTLHLEEKGTVYNEMVRTYEQPGALTWRRAGQLVYGARHPLALDSGGAPADIRRMSPKDIRGFHERNYHLANMGMIAAFPATMELGAVLRRTDAILVARSGRKGAPTGIETAPPPAPAAAGAVEIIEFPHQDARSPGSLMFAWPATRRLDLTELTLLELFLSAVAGDESTNLYKLLVDSQTRTQDLGATGVWAWVNHDLGLPVYLGVSDVAAAHLDAAGAQKVRALVVGELARIARLPAGDPELAALHERVRSRLSQTRRALAKYLNTPPGFGFRGTSSGWMDLLGDLERVPGFRKSLTLRPQLDPIEALLAAGGNPWTERLATWGLLEEPYALVSRPSPGERARLDRERDERLAAETARITKVNGGKDEADGLRRFAVEYDATTRKLEDGARATPMPPLVDALPMTFDDGLDYREHDVGGVPAVSSTFPGTTAGTVGLALRLDGVPAELHPVLALLPELLTQSGMIIDGRPVPADEVLERQRREVLSVRSWISADPSSGRVELVIEGQGVDAEETRRALAWMLRALTAPDWREANLPRLRDLVDRQVQAQRAGMLGPEEGWVESVRDAYARQTWPVFAHVESFLTAAHDAHRVRWWLQDRGDAAAREAAARYLDGVATKAAKLVRPRLLALAAALAGADAKPAAGKPAAGKPDAALARLLPPAKLSRAARELLREAGKDLTVLLPDLPDGSLAADWTYLCKQMAADLRHGAPAALAAFEQLRGLVLRQGGARLYVIGSAETQQAIAPDVAKLAAALAPQPALARVADGARFIDARLRARAADPKAPVFVGLVNPTTQSGVFVLAAPAPGYLDTGEDALLDYLASNLYSGHGAHGLFIKTWAAGLAYSNGIRVAPRQRALTYYAERCPELPQTLRFVIGELEKVTPDAALVDYALGQAFSSRVAASYESRGRGIAQDLADGLPPGAVRKFRAGLLALRARADLSGVLFARLARVYARVLPGYGKGWRPTPDAVYLVIGPDKQLDAWQKYLSAAVGADAKLDRLYPRDFWIPVKLD